MRESFWCQALFQTQQLLMLRVEQLIKLALMTRSVGWRGMERLILMVNLLLLIRLNQPNQTLQERFLGGEMRF